MKINTNDTNESLLTDILGYTPSRGQILEILKAVKESGRSIVEVAQERSFPEMFLVKGEKLKALTGSQDYDSIEDYRKQHPHRKVVLMSAHQ